MTPFKVIVVFFFTLSFLIPLPAQDSALAKAEEFFKNRFEEVVDGKAKPDNVKKAIFYYKKSRQEPEKYIGLLKSYEFLGSWTDQSKERRKEYYALGIKLGEEKIKLYPNNPGIIYWYVANYGRWGNLISIVKAAEEGILDKTREMATKVIELDPTYHEAGAYRMLGAIHLKAPTIPLVLTWPSKEKGVQLLKTAYKIAPKNAANAYFYSLALINSGNKRFAKTILDELVTRKPRPEFLLPDFKYIEKGKELLRDKY